MSERHVAFQMIDDDGLRVFSAAHARRGIAHVPDRKLAFAEFFEHVGFEHVVHKPFVFITRKHAVAVDDDAAGFLPAVLQREQRVIRRRCDRLRFGRKNAEYAALLMDMSRHIILPW